MDFLTTLHFSSKHKVRIRPDVLSTSHIFRLSSMPQKVAEFEAGREPKRYPRNRKAGEGGVHGALIKLICVARSYGFRPIIFLYSAAVTGSLPSDLARSTANLTSSASLVILSSL